MAVDLEIEFMKNRWGETILSRVCVCGFDFDFVIHSLCDHWMSFIEWVCIDVYLRPNN